MAFPLLSATAHPGAVARLSKCCRAFRAIFSDEDIWQNLCKRAKGLAGEPRSWRRAYGDWALSAQAFFCAYLRLLREVTDDESFGIRVEFEGRDLPEAWREHESLQAEEFKVADFGIFTTVELYWSDSDGWESLPDWDNPIWRRISCVKVLADYKDQSSVVFEVDAGEGCALDFAKLDMVRDAGMEVWHYCVPEDDPDDEDFSGNYCEDLGMRFRIPTARVLEAVLGAEEMKAAAAEWIGRGLRAPELGHGSMLFGDVRIGGTELATVASAWPEAVWQSPRRVHHFHRVYGAELRDWAQQKASSPPMPGYNFSFDLATSRALEGQNWWRCASSLWCLDACGNSAFACFRTPLRPGEKFKCSIRSGAKISASALSHFLACDWTPVESEESREVSSFHVFVPCFLQFPDLEGGRLLRASVADYAKRLAAKVQGKALHALPLVELAEHFHSLEQLTEADRPRVAGRLAGAAQKVP